MFLKVSCFRLFLPSTLLFGKIYKYILYVLCKSTKLTEVWLIFGVVYMRFCRAYIYIRILVRSPAVLDIMFKA